MRRLLLIFAVVALSACSVKLITPTQSDVDRVSTKFPGYTLSELNIGKTIYEQKCAQCHSLKAPSSETEDQWDNIVPDMVKRAADNPDATKFTDQDPGRILKYLVTMSTAMKPGK